MPISKIYIPPPSDERPIIEGEPPALIAAVVALSPLVLVIIAHAIFYG